MNTAQSNLARRRLWTREPRRGVVELHLRGGGPTTSSAAEPIQDLSPRRRALTMVGSAVVPSHYVTPLVPTGYRTALNFTAGYALSTPSADFAFLHQGTESWCVRGMIVLPTVGGIQTLLDTTGGGSTGNHGIWLAISAAGGLRVICGRGVGGSAPFDFTSSVTGFSAGGIRSFSVSWNVETQRLYWQVGTLRESFAPATAFSSSPASSSNLHVGVAGWMGNTLNGHVLDFQIARFPVSAGGDTLQPLRMLPL